MSAGESRGLEDEQYVGGVRNPNFAVARSKGMQSVGARLRLLLEEVASQPAFGPELDKAADWLGNAEAEGIQR